jgi:hypothetical protein
MWWYHQKVFGVKMVKNSKIKLRVNLCSAVWTIIYLGVMGMNKSNHRIVDKILMEAMTDDKKFSPAETVILQAMYIIQM